MSKSMRELLNEAARLFEDEHTITVDGHRYEVFVNRSYRGYEVEVYPTGGNNEVASASLLTDSETAVVRYMDEEGHEMEDFSSTNSDLYFSNIDKDEENMAQDVGSWLMSTHPTN